MSGYMNNSYDSAVRVLVWQPLHAYAPCDPYQKGRQFLCPDM